MDDEIRQDLYLLLCSEKVNVELMFNDDPDIGPLITCRLRPWKNDDNGGRMVIGGGLDVDDALFYACKALLADEWQPLDWRCRARVPGRYLATLPDNMSQFPTNRRKALHSAFFSKDEDGNKPTSPKVSQNGLQKQSEAVRIKTTGPRG